MVRRRLSVVLALRVREPAAVRQEPLAGLIANLRQTVDIMRRKGMSEDDAGLGLHCWVGHGCEKRESLLISGKIFFGGLMNAGEEIKMSKKCGY